jgi:branched-subunit amino acid aminotransferase/4-amino-4-deoxychorismate lyase
MSASTVYRWRDGGLEPLDYCDMSSARVAAADSWRVSEGRTLALELHRQRFADAAADPAVPAFWDAVLDRIPRSGEWFPRVERHEPSGALLYREREAPKRERSLTVATAPNDPRQHPSVKGPDLESLLAVRTSVQSRGASEAVILTPDGYVVEGAYSAIVWWRGSILCMPPADFARVDSVTARSLVGLATALGVETFEEPVTPAELDGTEVWALSAPHGPRIVTGWVDGPQLAELPGRLALWRSRLDALRQPLPTL